MDVNNLLLDINDVLEKYLVQQELKNGDYMFALANAYTAFVKDQESNCKTEDEVQELRSNAVDLIGNMIYNSTLD